MSQTPTILSDVPGKLFAVGDIHGCCEEVSHLLEHLKKTLTPDDTVIFIGDYIDRGPDTKGVVDTLLLFKEKYPRTHFLQGNHEEMFLGFLDGQTRSGAMFFPNGGKITLDSYGITDLDPKSVVETLPKEHLNFFRTLERYIITKEFVFVHAGLHPLADLLEQKDKHIYWIRDEFIQNIHKFEKLIVFGHTPYHEVMSHPGYKLGIDTGLVYGNKLSCVELTTKTLYQIAKGRSAVSEKELKL